MRKNLKILLSVSFCSIITILLTIAVAGCSENEDEDNSNERISIVVSIQPQAEFAEMVGGDRVNVIVMIPPGASPHTYEPTPAQLIEVSRAAIYAKVGSGIEFELAWMEKIIGVGGEMLVVDCSRGIELIENPGNLGNGNENEKHNFDPHIWLSLDNAAVMARNIYNGLAEVDPEGREYYKSNLEGYIKELEKLDVEIKDVCSGNKKSIVIVYHPVWAYFARDYGLEQIAIEEEGKEPTAEGIIDIIDLAKQHDIKYIFAAPEFNTQSAETIAGEMGGQVVLISPLEKDYIENMRNAALKFKLALE